jgi:hypothetical protein
MKKLKIALLAALVMAVPVFAFVSTTYAGDLKTGSNVVTKSDEVINRTLFTGGENVEINGEVNGDVICAGQNITINAKVNGDVICAGMNVRVNGTVDGDVRLAGQNVTLSGMVSGNASLAGEMITTEQKSKVGRDLQIGSNIATLNGQIGRDLHAGVEKLTLSSTLGRDLVATATNIELADGAKVGGSLTYYSDNKLQQADGASVSGKVTQEPMEKYYQSVSDQGGWVGLIFLSLMLLVFVLAVAALFPRVLGTVTEHAVTKPGTTLLIGLAAVIGVPIAIIVSFLTVVGILFGLALLLAWIVILILACVFFSYYLGRIILRTKQHVMLTAFVGALVLILLQFIPIVNVIATIASMLLGSGMAVRELLARTPKPAYAAGSQSSKKKA